MMNLSRRAFIGNIGLLSILLAAGNVHEGLSCVSSAFGSDNKITIPEDTKIRICFMGVGNTGLETGRALKRNGAHTVPRGSAKTQPVEICQFSANEYGIKEHLSECHLIFLAGSLDDKDFWLARDMVLDAGCLLVLTMVPSIPGVSLNSNLKPNAKESIIVLDKLVFQTVATTIVSDISSLFILPTLVGVDFYDLKIHTGSIGTGAFFESQLPQSYDQLSKLIIKNKPSIMNSDAVWMTLSYDYRADCTMEHMSQMSEMVYDTIRDDAEIVWSCNSVQELPSPFRASLVWIKKVIPETFPYAGNPHGYDQPMA